ncbi:MAG: lytic murein transglycosylase [Pseudomonas sp.]|uniref:lytic murein transglycosylase n=1 Tax=Pseudomonas sp. TaxID=306 RepID=UPI0033952FD1
MPYLPLRSLTCAALLLNGALLSACADTQAQTPPSAAPISAAAVKPPALTPAAAPPPVLVLSFDDWRQQLRAEALTAGISAELFDRALHGISLDPSVLAADSSQPEFSRPIWAYLDGAVSAKRVSQGQAAWAQQQVNLTAIEQRYAVPSEILVAIWGMESGYGGNIGSNNVIRSLVTLAYEGRRQGFWREQLLAALRILEQGDRTPEGLIGSWAGAMGQTQFMPTTYATHAVDFDGDGKRDLWGSQADALASTAHYLQASGWQPGQPWGSEVVLPQGFDYALADPQVRKTVSTWVELGIKLPAGFTKDTAGDASLLLPAGYRGPAFLVLANYRALLKYNNSTAYALAVATLSERLRGAEGIRGEWPRDERQLGRSERIELQELLTRHGYAPGVPDGIIGANTRNAVRAFQQRLGLPADGYPGYALLEQLRALP